MNDYKINVDGEELCFYEYANLTEPCPQCGAPACGKEDILWYESNDKKMSLIYDGGILDIILEEYLTQKVGDISDQPKFILEWNSAEGWTECWDHNNGHTLDKDDLNIAIKLLSEYTYKDWLEDDAKILLNHFREILAMSNKEKCSIKIVRG